MATKAKGAAANFDASLYVSSNVYNGVRVMSVPRADAHKRRVTAALVRAKSKKLAHA